MSDWFKNATLVGGSPTQPASKGAAAMSTRAMPTRAAAGQPAAAPAAAGPGDAELTHVAPGLGYNSFTGSKCGYPMEDAPLETIPANATGQKVTYDITSITSASELRAKIGVSAEASFSGFGVDASARAQWSREQATSTFSSYLLVRISVRNASLRLSEFRLNANALALVAKPDFIKEFYRRYGDSFISDYITGGEFLGLYEFQARSAKDRQDVAATVQGAGAMWKASGDFASTIEQLDVSADIRLSVFIEGGQSALPAFSPEKVLEFAQQFPNAVNPVSGFPVLYDTDITDYYKVEGFPASVDLPFAANHRLLDQLAKEMDRVRAGRSSLNFIRDNRGEFKEKTINEKHLRDTLQDAENTINGLAQTLADNAWQPGASIDLTAVRGKLDELVDALPEAKPAQVVVPRQLRTTQPGKGFYVIGNPHTGRILDIPGNHKSAGAYLQIWDRWDGENQLWRFEKLPDGSYIIKSAWNNLVVDVSGKSWSDGADIITWDSNDGSNQKWRLDAQPDGTVIIRSCMSDKVLDIKGGGAGNGAKVHQWTQHGNWNQIFFIEEVLALK